MSSQPSNEKAASEKATNYEERVSTNTRVFRELNRKLASDTSDEYVVAAKKFAKWLGDQKAYYMEARPYIVMLLETASYTLSRLANLRADQEFHITLCPPTLQSQVVAYTALVGTVRPYLPLFQEDALKCTRSLLSILRHPPIVSVQRASSTSSRQST
ncbi:hypothetical protein K439DRAFT_1063351 [Ramaria rubella]|nr:hypothetical protein K439DRAFT_1063351 [Ramaria rubella]